MELIPTKTAKQPRWTYVLLDNLRSKFHLRAKAPCKASVRMDKNVSRSDESPENMPELPKKPHPLASVGGIAGAIGGWTLSQYCGVFIWIPGAAILLFLILFNKSPIRPTRFSGAIAATAAHVTCFVIGSVITRVWSTTAPDIIALTLGIIWLWRRPSLPAVLFLGLVQIASLMYNAYTMSSVAFGSVAHRALTAHCVFRLIAIICLIVGYIRMRRELSSPPPVPCATTS
jgi:hypothetical protein